MARKKSRRTARRKERITTAKSREAISKLRVKKLPLGAIKIQPAKKRWFRADTAPLWFFILFAACALLHNLIFAATSIEEPVFFIISLVALFAFAVSLIYLIVLLIIKAFQK